MSNWVHILKFTVLKVKRARQLLKTICIAHTNNHYYIHKNC